MHHAFRITAIAAVVSAISVPASAADPTAVVVTATRQTQRSNELLSDVSVIDRSAIESAGQSTLGELLARQPGVQMTNSGGAGNVTSIYIRGASPTHTLLLIDGMRVGSASVGTPTFEALPLAQIERVEILRGPASALYGSDALGGVIQIFTRRGEGKPQVSASAGYGTYNTRELAGAVSGGDERISFHVGGGLFATDGFSSVVSAEKQPFNFDPDRDPSSKRHVSLGLSLRPATGHEIGLSLLNSDARSRYDNGIGFDSRIESAVTTLGVHSRNRLTSNWTSTLRAGRSIDDSTNFASFAPGGVSFRTDQDQLVWQNDVRLPLGQALLGVETLRQKASSQGNFDLSRRIDTLLAGWTGNLGEHRFQANVRSDDNSQFGRHTTGLLAYGYQWSPDWRAHASVASGFRAPNFNELYFPGFGNPNLKPEEALNRELGVVRETAQERFAVTYFRNRIDNLIVFDSTTFLPQNIGRAKIDGWSFSYAGEIARTSVKASLDLQRPRDAISGLRLVRRADQQATIEVGREYGAYRVGVEWQVVGPRYDNIANTRRMGGYALLNASVQYRLAPEWVVEARGNNLGDKRYETVWGYGVPAANVFVVVRYAPK